MVRGGPAGAPFGGPLTIRREKGGGAMAMFLFVIAAVALLAGLVGLVAGHVPRTTGCKKAPRVSVAS
jgi:hypothetical protein